MSVAKAPGMYGIKKVRFRAIISNKVEKVLFIQKWKRKFLVKKKMMGVTKSERESSKDN